MTGGRSVATAATCTTAAATTGTTATTADVGGPATPGACPGASAGTAGGRPQGDRAEVRSMRAVAEGGGFDGVRRTDVRATTIRWTSPGAGLAALDLGAAHPGRGWGRSEPGGTVPGPDGGSLANRRLRRAGPRPRRLKSVRRGATTVWGMGVAGANGPGLSAVVVTQMARESPRAPPLSLVGSSRTGAGEAPEVPRAPRGMPPRRWAGVGLDCPGPVGPGGTGCR